MNKIQKAQELADKLIDECICQVGDDKGALPDVPEDVEDSMEDLKDYVSMDGEELEEGDGATSHEYKKLGWKGVVGEPKMPSRGSSQNDVDNYNKIRGKIDSHMDKLKANRDSAMGNFYKKQFQSGKSSKDYNNESMVNNLATYFGEELEEGISSNIATSAAAGAAGGILGAGIGMYLVKRQCEKLYPDDPERQKKCRKSPIWKRKNIDKSEAVKEDAPVTGQALAKMRLGIERNDKNYKEGNDMDPEAKANAKKRVEESDQVATAQQKDTLFDKLERVVKDSDELKPTITTEPTTEADDSMVGNLATWLRGSVGMNTNKDKKKLAKTGKEADQTSANFYKKS